MKVKELLEALNKLKPEAEVVVMTSHSDGDDLVDWTIHNVTDSWSRSEEHDMVSLEVNLDQRPDWTHK